MKWDDVIRHVVATLRADPVFQSIYGSAIRMAGTGELQVPGLEWTLIGDSEVENWSPCIVQFDQWTLNQDDALQSEQRLRAYFAQELQIDLLGLKMFSQYNGGTMLETPNRSGYVGRSIRFQFTPLRRATSPMSDPNPFAMPSVYYTKDEVDALLANVEETSDIGVALASAKAYADAGDATILATAEAYADVGDATTLAQSQAYGNASFALLGHTHTFASLTAKPTTLAGYGITDDVSLNGHTHSFASLTAKPTTLAGYGITDDVALIERMVTVGWETLRIISFGGLDAQAAGIGQWDGDPDLEIVSRAGSLSLNTDQSVLLWASDGLRMKQDIPTGTHQFAGLAGTQTTEPSAVLHAESVTQGFLAPRLTTVQRDAIAAPAEGLEVYNVSTNTKSIFTGAVWDDVALNGHTHDANTLTGDTLAANVLASSLTSVGVLAGLVVTGFVAVNGPAASTRSLVFRSAGSNRWGFAVDADPETGANAGSGFGIAAYADSGAFIDSPLYVQRVAGGTMTISRPLTVTGTITGNVTGNLNGTASVATLATKALALFFARAINGVNFDGSANITVPAAAGTLTGTTLAATVVTSSLTSVGTLTALAVSGTASFGVLVSLNSAAGIARSIQFHTATVARWLFGVTNAAETGANAGTNLEMTARADDGSLLDIVLSCTRAVAGSLTTSRSFTTNGGFISVSGAAGTTRQVLFRTAGSNRFSFAIDNGAESGADAGSAFVINAYTDGAVFIDTPLGITRAAGGAFTIRRPLVLNFNLQVATGFGCNGKGPQLAVASGGAAPVGGVGTAAGGWDTAAHRDSAITLLNNIRTALVNNGIMS